MKEDASTLVGNWGPPMSVADNRMNTGAWCLFLLIAVTGVGLFFRFDGLGAVGLYHDEKYMALAVRGILETGFPYLPSGMFYPRAMTQNYLMTGSVLAFGENEWAFRFPSAVAGTLCIPLAYYLGRLYVGPILSLALAMTVAIFPMFIEVSQVARMYVFLVLTVLLFLIALGHWHRTGSWWSVFGMISVGVLGIEFQVLAVFLLPLVFIPLIESPSMKRMIQAGVTAVFMVVAYVLIEGFAAYHYSGTLAEEVEGTARYLPPIETAGFQQLPLEAIMAALAIAFIGILLVAWTILRPAASKTSPVSLNGELPFFSIGVLGLMAALVAAAFVSYLVAALSFIAGMVFYLRSGGPLRGPILVASIISLIFVGQAYLLLTSGNVDGVNEFIKFFIAFPAPTPEIRFVQFFPFAVLVFGIFCVIDLYRFIKGDKLPLYVLYFAFGVVAPMLAMGAVEWGIAPRYVLGLVPVYLLCFFMALGERERHFIQAFEYKRHTTFAVPAIVGLFTVAMHVSASDLTDSLDRSYGIYPDHKGAAEYIREKDLNPTEIVIVMEAPILTYYLGEVDYLLRHLDSVAWQARRVNGEVLDIFTGTPVLFNAERFSNVLNDNGRGAVYVIGSGEIHGSNDYDRSLGNEILELFELHDPELVFTGRDDKTMIWKFEPDNMSALSADTESP